jgi:glycosyltransferase involved in cell wall biosynthesis
MFFVEGDRKFFARGVSYGPVPPTLGEPFPEKPLVESDFAQIRALGANTIRVYHLPPDWLIGLAQEFGLRLLVGIPWAQHLRFLDLRSDRREIQRRVRDAAHALRHWPEAVLGLLVGNEIPPDVVRWYEAPRVGRFLRSLADEVKAVDPEALVSYANFPMTEYLEVDGLDFLSFNVYLHRIDALGRYLGRLQNMAAPRPLLLTEFGIDSIREGEARQAKIVARSVEEAARLGCAGTVVFSYTDEWHTGGFDVHDWAFGLVTRDRKAKPAFAAVQGCYRAEIPELPDPAPFVSVIVCAYQAERTLQECLESLRRLRYPRFEVIVVDDGSTDGTRAIAERFPEFRLISHENRGLSAARNDGIRAARGEVVAFTDADCAADPDWLCFLLHRLLAGEFAGVGGPNLPPVEEEWVAAAVARVPGGPMHVLLTDWEAEHVPGCNMAFWRRRLEEIGLFDPLFRTAGDDVDICWRLQDAGHAIGFAASALVWHRRRHTLRACLAQQAGYGRAEALLQLKHPHRCNGFGQLRWLGRIYTPVVRSLFGGQGVVYGGRFGRALFQTLYAAPASGLHYLPRTLRWNAFALGLLLFAALSYALGRPQPGLGLAGLLLFAVAAGQAVRTALAVDREGLPVARTCAVVAALGYLGPLVRGVARMRGHLRGTPRVPRVGHEPGAPRPDLDLIRRGLSISYWNETGIGKESCLAALLGVLKPPSYHVAPDDGWQPFDLLLHHGVWLRGRIKVLVANHGEQKRQINVGMQLRRTALSNALASGYAAGALASAGLGMWPAAALFAAALAALELSLGFELYRLAHAFRDAVAAAFRPLPVVALRADDGGPESR